jgi:hypothetical protein
MSWYPLRGSARRDADSHHVTRTGRVTSLARCALVSRGIVLLAAITACVEGPLSSPEDVGWVTTLVDSSTSALFAARTFAIPDTVVELEHEGLIDHAADHLIVDRIRNHFRALGWRAIPCQHGRRP